MADIRDGGFLGRADPAGAADRLANASERLGRPLIAILLQEHIDIIDEIIRSYSPPCLTSLSGWVLGSVGEGRFSKRGGACNASRTIA